MVPQILPNPLADLLEAAGLQQQQWTWVLSAQLPSGDSVQMWMNEKGDRLTLRMQDEHYLLSLNNQPLICS